MSSKKKTAVDWLVEQIHSEEYTHAFGKTYISVLFVDQAKAMEKEQIMKAVDVGFEEGSKFPEDIKLNDAEQYYNSTYGQ